MGLIKGVVIGMGVLIVAGFIVIAVTLVMRTQGGSDPERAYSTSASIPHGSRIEASQLDGDRILLQLAAQDGSTWLMVLESRTGQEKGRIKLLPEAP